MHFPVIRSIKEKLYICTVLFTPNVEYALCIEKGTILSQPNLHDEGQGPPKLQRRNFTFLVITYIHCPRIVFMNSYAINITINII
jgi:hypothetical protein